MNIKEKIEKAYEIGLKVPEVIFIKNYSKDQLIERTSGKEWNILSKDNLLIEKINGVEVQYVCYFDGEDFSFKLMAIHDDWLLTGEQGVRLNDNLITIFEDYSHFMDKYFNNLKQDKGFYLLKVILVDNKVYFNDISFALSDGLHNCINNFYGVDDIYVALENGESLKAKDKFGVSMKAFAFPFGFGKIQDKRIEEDEFFISLKESYLAVNTGRNIFKSWNKLIKEVDKRKVNNLCYRIDGNKKAGRVYNDLKRKRYIV